MSETKVGADDLGKPIDLASGERHSVEVENKLKLACHVGVDTSGVHWIVRDADGKEVKRVAVSESEDAGEGYRALDLSTFDADGALEIGLYRDGAELGAPARVTRGALEQAFAEKNDSAIAENFGSLDWRLPDDAGAATDDPPRVPTDEEIMGPNYGDDSTDDPKPQ